MSEDECIAQLKALGHNVVNYRYGSFNCVAVDLTTYQILDPREHPDFDGVVTEALISAFGGY